MMNAWIAIDRGGSFIKGKLGTVATKLNAPFKDAPFPPEVQNVFLYFREIYLAAYWLEHKTLIAQYHKSPSRVRERDLWSQPVN